MTDPRALPMIEAQDADRADRIAELEADVERLTRAEEWALSRYETALRDVRSLLDERAATAVAVREQAGLGAIGEVVVGVRIRDLEQRLERREAELHATDVARLEALSENERLLDAVTFWKGEWSAALSAALKEADDGE